MAIELARTIHRAEVRFGTQGRLTVPASIRKALGFRLGERLVARIEDEKLVIEKPASVEHRIRARFRNAAGRSLADELVEERRDEVRREVGR